MKKFIYALAFVSLFLRLSAQNPEANKYKSNYIQQGNYLSPSAMQLRQNNYGDSLTGFDENAYRLSLESKAVFGLEYISYMNLLKRRYIDAKYNLTATTIPNIASNPADNHNPKSKLIGSGNVIANAPCVNEGFESTPAGPYTTGGAVSGWTVSSMSMNGCTDGPWTSGSSEFSIATTPIAGFPGIGTLPNSPFGGTKVARLNNYINNYSKTKISTTFPVTASNTLFQIAFAGYFSSVSSCCDAPGFYTKMVDCFNAPLTCGNFTLGPSCNSGGTTFTTTGGGTWTNWVVKSIDLTPYIGSCVTFECWCNDNTFGGSYACAAFDARCGNALAPGLNPLGTNTLNAVNFCAGSGIAQLNAPPGYATYSWTAPPLYPMSIAQSSLAAATITNPLAGNIYSVTCSNPNTCTVTLTYTLSSSQVNIVGYGSSPSCSVASAGSASVQASGSSVGYSYLWINATNSVVSTNSVASGLAPGPYTVAVGAPGYTACGAAFTTVTVQVGSPPPNMVNAYYCGSNAYLFAGSGSNFQWYNGVTAITGTIGTAPAYTITSPVNNSIYRLTKTYFGCSDSTIFTLVAANAGTLSASISGNGCLGAAGASAIVNFTPIPNSNPFPGNTYSVGSIGIIPAYLSYTLNTSSLSYTASNLLSGYTYTISAFDGSCYSNLSFLVASLTPSVNPLISPQGGQICSGNSQTVTLSMPSSIPGQYTYSWSPATFLSPGSNSMQTVIMSPTISSGNSGTMVYTVIITPTLANCPITATYGINYTNPPLPIINSIPTLCYNSGIYTITAFPGGGTFSPSAFMLATINPTYTPMGLNTLTYAVSSGSCVASASASFVIYPNPTLNVSGTNTACNGTALSFTASGADVYIWSTSFSGSVIILNPSQSGSVSVAGTNLSGNCQSVKTLTFNILPLPLLSVSGPSVICKGESDNLIVSGASTYSWNNGSNTALIPVNPVITTTYVVSGSDANTGCVNSASFVLTVSKCTGIKAYETESGLIKLYPNPVNRLLFIECLVDLDLSIYNNLGQLVYQTFCDQGKTNLDLSKLADGAYYLNARTKKNTVTFKLIKHNN